ncbi:MAG: DUF4143 domain-containing protein [Chlorobium sp.]|uniref:hypothetical protein n=1 Tax=Chlorobium sp. TaxID=1095 RepID=UPI0025C20A6B|nr:hypothetical protein [Chlorobium sp.]MCF8382165.1 DUF4143 domain-containing protein [Chlorobium sp.]
MLAFVIFLEPTELLPAFLLVIVRQYYRGWRTGREARDEGLFFYRDTDQQEVYLDIESGDTLYPVEIKKTASPSQHGRFGFGALDKLGRNVGPGAVVCFVGRDVPLSESVTAVPVGYI